MREFLKNVLMYLITLVVLFIPIYVVASLGGGSFDVFLWKESVRNGVIEICVSLFSVITIIFFFKMIYELM